MFIAVFTTAKIWKQPKCSPVDEWIKMWYIKIQWSISHKKKNNKILSFITAWMVLQGIMLSEINQTEKDKYHMISLICNLKHKTNEQSVTDQYIQRTNW